MHRAKSEAADNDKVTEDSFLPNFIPTTGGESKKKDMGDPIKIESIDRSTTS